jgi:hypothetical protein
VSVTGRYRPAGVNVIAIESTFVRFRTRVVHFDGLLPFDFRPILPST